MNEQNKTDRLLFRGKAKNGFEYRATVAGKIVQLWSTESGCIWRLKRAMHVDDFEAWAVKERLLEHPEAVGDKIKALADALTVNVNNS